MTNSTFNSSDMRKASHDYNLDHPLTLTEAAEFIDAINTAINTITFGIDRDAKDDVESFRHTLISAIDDDALYEYLCYINCGSFKECYEAINWWIVKFVSQHNETDKEKFILNAAKEAGLDRLFIPTIFIDLPKALTATAHGVYVTYDTELHRTDCKVLVSMQFQPRVTTSIKNLNHFMNYHATAEEQTLPVRYNSGKLVSLQDLNKLCITDLEWIQAVINLYGDEFFHKFLAFTEKHYINDLHAENTAWLDTEETRIPVIIDWLSR